MKNTFLHITTSDGARRRASSYPRDNCAIPAMPSFESSGTGPAFSSEMCGQTSMVLRNIPKSFSRSMLCDLLETHRCLEEVDFLYLPIRHRDGRCLGYAFINFTTSAAALSFHWRFHHMQLPCSLRSCPEGTSVRAGAGQLWLWLCMQTHRCKVWSNSLESIPTAPSCILLCRIG